MRVGAKAGQVSELGSQDGGSGVAERGTVARYWSAVRDRCYWSIQPVGPLSAGLAWLAAWWACWGWWACALLAVLLAPECGV